MDQKQEKIIFLLLILWFSKGKSNKTKWILFYLFSRKRLNRTFESIEGFLKSSAATFYNAIGLLFHNVYFIPFFTCVAGSPCEHDGICVNTPGSFACNCTQGFTGPRCETNVNECESHPCQNDGSCLDDPGTFRCVCMPGKSYSTFESDYYFPSSLFQILKEGLFFAFCISSGFSLTPESSKTPK